MNMVAGDGVMRYSACTHSYGHLRLSFGLAIMTTGGSSGLSTPYGHLGPIQNRASRLDPGDHVL